MSTTVSLDGRVIAITGAGRGIGREHALFLAAHGAPLVIDDLGGSTDGSGSDAGPAQQLVDEIHAAGDVAAANADDVADSAGATPAGRPLRSARQPCTSAVEPTR